MCVCFKPTVTVVVVLVQDDYDAWRGRFRDQWSKHYYTNWMLLLWTTQDAAAVTDVTKLRPVWLAATYQAENGEGGAGVKAAAALQYD